MKGIKPRKIALNTERERRRRRGDMRENEMVFDDYLYECQAVKYRREILLQLKR